MTRERWADEPDPGPLLVCHRPPCDGRVYHDQTMHDFLAHNPHPITVDSPLGDLVAGRIDQAEYRRRMADLERRAADSLDVEPGPARYVRVTTQRYPWIWVIVVIVGWVGAAIVIGSLVIHALIWLVDATSRSAAAPHDPAAGGEMAGVVRVSLPAWDTSGGPLTGAPHEREAPSWAGPSDRHDGGAP